MILDYRIYCTIYAVGFLGSFVICQVGMATVDNDRAQTLCSRAMAPLATILLLTGLSQYLDWLWS